MNLMQFTSCHIKFPKILFEIKNLPIYFATPKLVYFSYNTFVSISCLDQLTSTSIQLWTQWRFGRHISSPTVKVTKNVIHVIWNVSFQSWSLWKLLHRPLLTHEYFHRFTLSILNFINFISRKQQFKRPDNASESDSTEISRKMKVLISGSETNLRTRNEYQRN
jgi:hypothetical protein